ncbi:MAG: polysaccharide deacetylase family protein [Bacteroidia bacterium]|nr:polysaccharide deacetylase family protein [Bacteroidia bacterium]MCZ2248449.1 polysaccharide deacetylase family protein [Bacteroidia bacterium]
MKIITPPIIITSLFHSLEWQINDARISRKLYLSFDDGPTPQVTDFVLNQLCKNSIKASFFCIGANIKKEPQLFQELIKQQHRVGNHTQHHVNGWKTNTSTYLNEIEACEKILQEYGYQHDGKPLFRPPYGKITRDQIKALKHKYRIIMWSILGYDWLPYKNPHQCLRNILKPLRSNAIIVLHDSLKASINIKHALPEFIKQAKDQGYTFDKI